MFPNSHPLCSSVKLAQEGAEEDLFSNSSKQKEFSTTCILFCSQQYILLNYCGIIDA